MEIVRTRDAWKILIVVLVCLTGLFIFLVALASSQTRGNEDPPGLSAPEKPGLSSPKQGGPVSVLKDFEFVPGSAVLVDQRHVLALYKNAKKEFYAVVLFNADCDRSGCTPKELIAFSIVDREGQDVEFANDLGVKSLRGRLDI
jgi:hypothetical protein